MATATLTFGRNSITKEFTGAVTVGEVATKTNLTFLGAPSDSVSFVVDGNAVDAATLLQDGDEVYVEQKAHNKAADEISVTLTYGRNSITKILSEEATVGDLTTKTNLTFLGAPADSVKFVIDGEEVNSATTIEDGDEIYVEQKAHNKAK